MLLASLRFGWLDLLLYDQPSVLVSLRLKVRILNAKTFKLLIYECVVWSPNAKNIN